MQYERRWVSFPDLELRINWMYFYWTVFNAFLQGMLGGAVLGQIPNLVKHPSATRGHPPFALFSRRLPVLHWQQVWATTITLRVAQSRWPFQPHH